MSIFNILTDKSQLILFLFRIPIVLLSLSFHEAAHGLIAYKNGDPTARNLGRLSMNPLVHLDPIGTVCMLLFGIGWAKPVPVNTRYFNSPKKGMALVACAGPVSNFILSLGALLVSVVVGIFARGNTLLICICYFFYYLHLINLMLGLFNLIPVPPLDGSRIAFIFLPDRVYFGIMKYERIIKLVFLMLLFTTGASFIGNICLSISDGLIELLPDGLKFDFITTINTFSALISG